MCNQPRVCSNSRCSEQRPLRPCACKKASRNIRRSFHGACLHTACVVRLRTQQALCATRELASLLSCSFLHPCQLLLPAGVVLTMFLSLTAMQFVFDFPPANYINALQIVSQHTLADCACASAAARRGSSLHHILRISIAVRTVLDACPTGIPCSPAPSPTHHPPTHTHTQHLHDDPALTPGLTPRLPARRQVVLVSYVMISIACIESLIVNRIATVNRVVSNKRTCMRKYGNMLAK